MAKRRASMAERIDKTEGDETAGRAAFDAGGYGGPEPGAGGGAMVEVAVDLIDPAPDNPRGSVGHRAGGGPGPRRPAARRGNARREPPAQ